MSKLNFEIIKNTLEKATKVSMCFFSGFGNKKYKALIIEKYQVKKNDFGYSEQYLFGSRNSPRYTLNGVTSWCLTDKDMLGYYFYKVGSAKAEQEVKLQTLDKMRALPTKH